jgi:hypothetical protein
MMKQLYSGLVLWFLSTLLVFTTIGTANAQSTSNAGTEFWGVFPTHVPVSLTSLANLTVFITGSQASSGVITVGSTTIPFTVTANVVTSVSIPRSAAYINSTEAGQVLTGRAIHIKVDSGKPKVVVYEHIFAGKRSEATLLLPKDALSQK